MKKRIVPLLAGLCLLSGCAGMNSDFDCNAKAQDRCETMDQANQQARQRTGGQVSTAAGKPAAADALPRLAPVPVSPSPMTGIQAATRAGGVQTASRHVATPVAGSSRTSLIPHSAPAPQTTVASVSPVYMSFAQVYADTGITPPVRVNPTTARLWIAGWIDGDDVLHQPAVVSFVVAPDHWAGS